MVGEGGNYINVNCTYLLAPFLRIARNATFETISCEGNLITQKICFISRRLQYCSELVGSNQTYGYIGHRYAQLFVRGHYLFREFIISELFILLIFMSAHYVMSVFNP